MNFTTVLARKSLRFYGALIALGIVNSFVYSGILVFINQTIAQKPVPYVAGLEGPAFAAMLLLSFFSNRLFRFYTVRLTNDILFEYETMILQKVKQASFAAFEKLGTEKVYTIIGDIRLLARTPELLIEALNSAIIIVCGLGFLFISSAINAIVVVGVMIGLLVVYLIRNQRIEQDLTAIRSLQDNYYRYLHDLLGGFRELKMNHRRNENLYNQYLQANLSASRRLHIQTANRYTDNELIGTYSWYVIMGLIMFGLPFLIGLTMGQVATFVITILYLMRPVAILVGVLPFYNNAKIGIDRIQAFSSDLSQPHQTDLTPAETDSPEPVPFDVVRFVNVAYAYTDESSQRTFKVGPLNLSVRQGEITFVTGGNGSGKSTFVNLLIGLVKPDQGAILLDGHPLHEAEAANLVSVVFTNPYLFSENYDGFSLSPDNERLQTYIRWLHMEDVVSMLKDKALLSHKLSKGQQKRLALIYALMEERPILVLDEWAAEQDPEFRAYFYEELLPILKQAGKTIIAVSHDDAYFDCADRLLKFDFGRVIADHSFELVTA
jgi:cyclic peptide transporter